MENIRKGNETGEKYIVSFRKILQEAEERDKQAMEILRRKEKARSKE